MLGGLLDGHRARRHAQDVADRLRDPPDRHLRLADASTDNPPSMRAIAREAVVGIGTLYRHFPTREALLDAVYHDQADRLTHGARELLAQYPPAEAMRRWMDLFGRGSPPSTGCWARSPPARGHPQSRARMLTAVVDLLDAGTAAGDIRSDVTAEDLVAHLVGIFSVASDEARRPQAARLLDVLMDGLAAVMVR